MPTFFPSTSDVVEKVRQQYLLKYEPLEKKTSEFAGMFSANGDGMILRKADISKGQGASEIFKKKGWLSGTTALARESASGMGEELPVYAMKIDLQDISHAAKEFDDFDARIYGLEEYAEMVATDLINLQIRNVDQYRYAALLGVLNGQTPSHVIRVNGAYAGGSRATMANVTTGDKLSWAALKGIERVLRTGNGYDTGSPRFNPPPLVTEDGERCWLMFVTPTQAWQIKTDSTYNDNVRYGDPRGKENRLWRSVIGKVGRLYIVEKDQFFGTYTGADYYIKPTATVEMPGMFSFTASSGAVAPTGTTPTAERAVIVGASALVEAWGMQPKITVEKRDHEKTIEYAIRYWFNVAKFRVDLKAGKDFTSVQSGIDYGTVAVESSLL